MECSTSPCRLCFDGFGDELCIWDKIYIMNETLRIADIVNVCIQLQLDENDDLPQSICGNCKYNLVQYYEFRQKCYETDLFLRVKPESAILNQVSDMTEEDSIANSNLFNIEVVDIPEYVLVDETRKDIKEKPNETRKLPTLPASNKLPKEKKIHKCDICLKEFKTGSHLRGHYEIHSDSAKYLCSVCGQTFKSKQCLLNHSKRHSGLYECKICKRGYSSKSQLLGHMRVHTGERPFKCKICNSAFKANASLKIHVRLHTGDKPFKCRFCDKRFVVSHQKRSHELVHGDKTYRPYKCAICSKDFQKRDLYVQHQKIHLDERQFKCDYCDKEFVYRKNWIVHLRTHTGEKPYKCPLCGKKFAQRVCMRTHVDKVHPDQAEQMKAQNFILS